MADSVPVVYFAVSNIPASFRSADLRNYFSQFIESGGFQCFHFRHRPEILRESESTQLSDVPEEGPTEDNKESSSKSSEAAESCSLPKQGMKTCCCVVSVHFKEADRFVQMYAGNQWINSKGNWLARRCVIKRIKVSWHTGS